MLAELRDESGAFEREVDEPRGAGPLENGVDLHPDSDRACPAECEAEGVGLGSSRKPDDQEQAEQTNQHGSKENLHPPEGFVTVLG
jgi:hypothetical protein